MSLAFARVFSDVAPPSNFQDNSETVLFCSNTALTQIKVSITNNGLNSISNIPISVTVSNNSGASEHLQVFIQERF